eukprot:5941149-Pleurochrysis_carterae.AAC.1
MGGIAERDMLMGKIVKGETPEWSQVSTTRSFARAHEPARGYSAFAVLAWWSERSTVRAE